MKKFYYGIWNNLYSIDWPFRFLIELIVGYVLFCLIILFLKKLGRLFQLKTYFVKICTLIVTEMAFWVGHNKKWVLNIDQKIVEWANQIIDTSNKNKGPAWKTGLAFLLVLVYLLAVFVDLPVSQYFQDYYLIEAENIKQFFQKWEQTISKGYEQYPPLFVKKEPKRTDEKETCSCTCSSENQASSTFLFSSTSSRGESYR